MDGVKNGCKVQSPVAPGRKAHGLTHHHRAAGSPELPFMSPGQSWGTSPFVTHSPEWHEEMFRRAMARFDSMPILIGKDHPHYEFWRKWREARQ